jgi:uncharacterized LabA/DUF88 family protein
MERVCIFIDGSNFYFALKRNNRVTRVDYYQLSLALAGPDRKLVRTYYYNVAYDKNQFPDKAKTQMSFLDSLDRTPYLELRLGRLVPSFDGNVQERGMDVLIASDMVYYAARKAFDTAIVVTEDAVYSSVLEEVKELGRHIEIATFQDSQSRELIRASDLRIPLDTVLDQFSTKIFPSDVEDNRGGTADRVGKVLKSFMK